jgi:hypothetical protein
LSDPEAEFFEIRFVGDAALHPMIFESKTEENVLYVFNKDTNSDLNKLQI